MTVRYKGRPIRNQLSAAGFTLIELVVTMAVSVIVISFAAVFVSAPVQGFVDQARRVKLTDSADSALQLVRRDIQRSLPNSLRVTSTGSIVALELLSTVDGARYRRESPGTADQILDLAAADASFNTIGTFTRVSKPFSSTSHYLSVYNVGVPGASAWELVNVMTPPGTLIEIAEDVAGEDRVSMSPPFRFAYGSPAQRVYLVEGPVSYLCNQLTGSLTRYSGYSIASDQSDRDSTAELLAAGADAAIVAGNVENCSFTYAPGTTERAGLVTIEIDVGEQGEVVSLLSQVHVVNVP